MVFVRVSAKCGRSRTQIALIVAVCDSRLQKRRLLRFGKWLQWNQVIGPPLVKSSSRASDPQMN
jgi:hypothetical protein